jgi:hypothetical protein
MQHTSEVFTYRELVDLRILLASYRAALGKVKKYHNLLSLSHNSLQKVWGGGSPDDTDFFTSERLTTKRTLLPRAYRELEIAARILLEYEPFTRLLRFHRWQYPLVPLDFDRNRNYGDTWILSDGTAWVLHPYADIYPLAEGDALALAYFTGGHLYDLDLQATHKFVAGLTNRSYSWVRLTRNIIEPSTVINYEDMWDDQPSDVPGGELAEYKVTVQ